MTFTWTSSDATIATIPSTGGVATSKGLGTATISAATGGVTGSSTLTVAAHYYVAPAGSDANAGTSVAPFKTITKALSVAVTGNVVKVLPGRYSAANGETFPLVGAPGVSLIGDEANKGGGGTPTIVIMIAGGSGSMFTPPANALIAGFTITDSASTIAVSVSNTGLTLRNNRLVNSPYIMVYFTGSTSTGHMITGNLIDRNGVPSTSAVAFVGGSGASSKFENNTITNNGIGVEYDNAGPDLGGGAVGSVGGNILSCNARSDLWTVSGLTIAASNNKWDHVPLTTATTGGGAGGVDFYNTGGTTVLTSTGATVAPSNCP